MNWILLLTGAGLIILGIVIWQFKLTQLLSNVDQSRLVDKEKAARLAAFYLIFLGFCFVIFGYMAGQMTDKTIVMTIACFIPVNMIFVVSYLFAQSRNHRS